MNIPLLFVFSIIPDIDLLIPGITHRGPTHSIIFILLFFPVFIFYKKDALPYLISMGTHSVIGDYLTDEGIQLFWPVTTKWYGIGIPSNGPTNIFMEWSLFIIFLTAIYWIQDLCILLRESRSNLLLLIPILTVLLPTVFSFPLHVPLELLFPHLVYLSLFSIAVIVYLKKN